MSGSIPPNPPKAIDVDFTTPEGVTGTLVGLYQFRGEGILWLAFDGRGARRPTDFPTNPGSGDGLMEFKRNKQ